MSDEHTDHRLRRMSAAAFADGQTSEGRIVGVTEHPTGGSENGPSYEIVLHADLPSGIRLRRVEFWGDGDASGPDGSWVGRAVRFRHNTLDPEDLHDFQFDRFPDGDPHTWKRVGL